eukprot:scaffold3906_cov120-Isochrysis_galbana.AAC.5
MRRARCRHDLPRMCGKEWPRCRSEGHTCRALAPPSGNAWQGRAAMPLARSERRKGHALTPPFVASGARVGWPASVDPRHGVCVVCFCPRGRGPGAACAKLELDTDVGSRSLERML